MPPFFSCFIRFNQTSSTHRAACEDIPAATTYPQENLQPQSSDIRPKPPETALNTPRTTTSSIHIPPGHPSGPQLPYRRNLLVQMAKTDSLLSEPASSLSHLTPTILAACASSPQAVSPAFPTYNRVFTSPSPFRQGRRTAAQRKRNVETGPPFMLEPREGEGHRDHIDLRDGENSTTGENSFFSRCEIT